MTKKKKKKEKKQVVKVYQLRLTLLGSLPTVYRVVQIKADTLLSHLHCIIQILFEWDNEHLYEFQHKKHRYGLITTSDDYFFENEQLKDANKYTVLDLKMRKNSSFYYIYDFGDAWEIGIKVENLLFLPADEIDVPKLIEWGNITPPEDFGGIYFFNTMVGKLKNSQEKIVAKDEEEDWRISELIDKFKQIESDSFAQNIQENLNNYQENCYSQNFWHSIELGDDIKSDNSSHNKSDNLAEIIASYTDKYDIDKITSEEVANILYNLNPWGIFKQTELFGIKIGDLSDDIFFFSFLDIEEHGGNKVIQIIKGTRGMKVFLAREEENNITLALDKMFIDGFEVAYIDFDNISLEENLDDKFRELCEEAKRQHIKILPYESIIRRKDLVVELNFTDDERYLLDILLFVAYAFVSAVTDKRLPHPSKANNRIPVLNFDSEIKLQHVKKSNKIPPLDIALPTPDFDLNVINNHLKLSNIAISTDKKWAIGYTFVPNITYKKHQTVNHSASLFIVDIEKVDIVYNSYYDSEYELFDNMVKDFLKAIEENKLIPIKVLFNNKLIEKYLKKYANALKIKTKTEQSDALDFILNVTMDNKLWDNLINYE